MDESIPKGFLFPEQVKKDSKEAVKIRLLTLIKAKGMSAADFYKKLGLTKQYWFRILNQKDETTPLELKIKIAAALGTDSGLIWQERENDKR